MRGFTLTELIVVIGLIGIVAAITLVAINPVAQIKKGNDARRKSDIRRIQGALELYRAEIGVYPPKVGGLPACGQPLKSPDGTITFLAKIPCDPLGASYYNGGDYYYNGYTGTRYTLIGCLQNTRDPDGQFIAGGGCTTNYFYFAESP